MSHDDDMLDPAGRASIDRPSRRLILHVRSENEAFYSPYYERAKLRRSEEAVDALMKENQGASKNLKYEKCMACLVVLALIGLVSYVVFVPDFLEPEEFRQQNAAVLGEDNGHPMDNFADIFLPEGTDARVPFFWDIPMSGGAIVEDILGKCNGLVIASAAGVLDGHGRYDSLRTVEVFEKKYVNVDTSSPEGIERAMRLDLASSGLPDVIISPMLYESSTMFGSSAHGKMFALFRDPIERAVNVYNAVRDSTWDPQYNPRVAEMSLKEYASSEYVENNWLTRSLTNHTTGDLRDEHLEEAKEILRKKCVVGLWHNLTASLAKFERNFDLKKNVILPVNECQQSTYKEDAKWYESGSDSPEEDSDDLRLLQNQNEYDMQLYDYVVELWDTQKAVGL